MSMIPTGHYGGRRNNIFDPFSMDIWDPFRDFLQFSQHNSSLMPHHNNEASLLAHTKIDWRETQDAHIFKADLPGIRKEEVKVEVEDDRVLQISGERCMEQEDKNDTWHRVECSRGKFMRKFRLPENAKMDCIKASMENGVLTIMVPKVEAKKRDIRCIEVSG